MHSENVMDGRSQKRAHITAEVSAALLLSLAIPLAIPTLLAADDGRPVTAGGDPATSDLTSLQAAELAVCGFSDKRNISLDTLCDALYPDAKFAPELSVGMLVGQLTNIDDGSFHQGTFDGIDAAARCFGVQTAFFESSSSDTDLMLETIRAENLDAVVSVGVSFQESIAETAALHPDVQFIGVDQLNPDGIPNFTTVSADNWQVGYLAGVAAGLVTETGKTGVIAGPEFTVPVVEMADGFEAGVAAVAPEASVLRKHVETFTDPPLGAETAMIFLKSGVDVLFAAAGKTGSGAIAAAAVANSKVIGVDVDQYFTTFRGGSRVAADQLVTSAIKRVDLGVFLSIASIVSSDHEGGEFVLNAANGGISYSEFHDAIISAEDAHRLEQARRDLASGNVIVPAH